ncbi:MAG: aminotransferase class I/II-fold pyridoxal phosphate-dependent enzyme, partial [Fibromonadales bacterium]|nr:aminotransferase class I/II-fold pyridoxal phosphate-dependent enzyme [Fibromonadales bacterium]
AGLRIGYGIASANIINTLKKIKLPFNSSYPAQIAAAAAIEDRDFIEKSLNMNTEGREHLTKRLQSFGFEVLPSSANFICVRIDPRAAELVAWLESKGVIVRQLSSFGLPEYVRITVGTKRENSTLLALLTYLFNK